MRLNIETKSGINHFDDISHLPPLRQEYIKEVRNLKNTVDLLYNQGKTTEEVARTVSQMRRDLGIKYKDMTPPELREMIYKTNMEDYGDPLDPTIEYLRNKKGKSWEEIIESACKEGGGGLPGTKENLKIYMKGPFFHENRINYDLLEYSNFEDVDIAINAILLKYNVMIEEKIEVFDSYWITVSIDDKYNIKIRHHDPIGLTIYAQDEQSNNMVTEIANYLAKEVFNEREDIGYKP